MSTTTELFQGTLGFLLAREQIKNNASAEQAKANNDAMQNRITQSENANAQLWDMQRMMYDLQTKASDNKLTIAAGLAVAALGLYLVLR